MSRLNTAINNDLNALRLLRDELALQAHLFKADMKDRWRDLEAQMDVLKEHVERAKVAAGDSGKQAEAALQKLISSLRTGYNDIKKALSV